MNAHIMGLIHQPPFQSKGSHSSPFQFATMQPHDGQRNGKQSLSRYATSFMAPLHLQLLQ